MGQTGNAHRIIVALDVGTRSQALSLVESLPEGQIFKVGLQLFTAEGPSLIQEIAQRGKRVFLDLKLHDIPNTIAGAVSMAAGHGVAMMTLHASGGREMMRRAAEVAADKADAAGRDRPLLLGVTVLTSLKDAELGEIGMPADAAGQVLKLARLAQSAGMDGIVCSPLELGMVRAEFGREFLVVTPGIRPAWAAAQDQKRIMTPEKALAGGADYLVIGRPITAAPSPGEAFARIRQALDGADTDPHGEDGA
ncbi:MAG: orotidine-5'-phosphate decarboxylase [Candidatus Aminicenantaceae bacterium]|jgi:orotidine-5'-phosphate decarboxylase